MDFNLFAVAPCQDHDYVPSAGGEACTRNLTSLIGAGTLQDSYTMHENNKRTSHKDVTVGASVRFDSRINRNTSECVRYITTAFPFKCYYPLSYYHYKVFFFSFLLIT